MRLTEDETGWINIWLKTCKIKFREVYEEVYDHIVSAIELKRSEGDERGLDVLFMEVVDADFGGIENIRWITTVRAKALKDALWMRMWDIIKENRNVSILISTVILLITCFLPKNRTVNEALAEGCFILAFTPLGYVTWRKGIKNVLFDRSLKVRTMAILAYYSVIMFNLLFCLIFGSIRVFGDFNWKPARDCSPLVYSVLLVCLLIFNINFIQLFNREFKTKIAA